MVERYYTFIVVMLLRLFVMSFLSARKIFFRNTHLLTHIHAHHYSVIGVVECFFTRFIYTKVLILRHCIGTLNICLLIFFFL